MGVPDLSIKVGRAPEIFAQLPAPDAIFVGGGGAEVIDAAFADLPAARILVVNAVTLETQSHVVARQALCGGRLTMIDIAEADALGSFRAWQRPRPIVQWVVRKA
jgi:precorrin-6Y C5,15-methyltransferase (decarboxylating)